MRAFLEALVSVEFALLMIDGVCMADVNGRGGGQAFDSKVQVVPH